MKFLFLFLFPLASLGQIKLEHKVTLMNERIEIMVPNNLSEMKDEIWKQKYQDLPRPQRVLTDENNEVGLLMNMTKQPLVANQIYAYKERRIDQLRDRSDIKILAEGIKSVNGKKIGFIKFTSQSKDQGLFNYYFFTEVEGNVLFISFYCPEKVQKPWDKTLDEILNSFRFQEN